MLELFRVKRIKKKKGKENSKEKHRTLGFLYNSPTLPQKYTGYRSLHKQAQLSKEG